MKSRIYVYVCMVSAFVSGVTLGIAEGQMFQMGLGWGLLGGVLLSAPAVVLPRLLDKIAEHRE